MHTGCESLISLGLEIYPFKRQEFKGNTTWDILQEQTKVDNRELKDMLHRAGALSGSSLPTVTSYAHYIRQPKSKFRETF